MGGNNTFDLGNLKGKFAKPNLVYVLLNDIEQLDSDKVIFDIFLSASFLFLGALFSNFSWRNLFWAGLGLIVAGIYLIKIFKFQSNIKRNLKPIQRNI
jgi:hypothetical protein